MTVFHIAHLSDLHFGVSPRRGNMASRGLRSKLAAVLAGHGVLPPTHDPDCAEMLAAELYQRANRLDLSDDELDLLIVSGDLATTGLQDDLAAAHRFLESSPDVAFYRNPGPGETPYSADLATLEGIATHQFYVPGNHDRYMNNHFVPGSTLFDTVFSARLGTMKNGVQSILLTKAGNPGHGNSAQPERLAIIGADGCLRDSNDASTPTQLFMKGQGRLYPDTLQELIDRTNLARQAAVDVTVVWVVHFPPHDHVPLLFRMRDFEALESESALLGVKVILSGHTHSNRIYPAFRGCEVWNCGSSAQYLEKRGNWFNMLDIEITNNSLVGIRREKLFFDAAAQAFVTAGVETL